MRFDRFEVLTFDCYGTLIDWEKGILSVLKPIFSKHAVNVSDEEVLKTYAEIEAKIEKGPFIKYKKVLQKVMQEFCNRYNLNAELDCLVNSLKDWPPFPDTVPTLKAFKKRYKLAIISNIDKELFSFTQKRLLIKFDWIILSEEIKAYKPSLINFEYALKKINIPKERILHIAQSLYHDINPAKKLGLNTVLVKRRGFGATLPVLGHADIEVPDLKTLLSIMKV
ncbi:MAG TPA: haloacid dehalogenase type II [Candidatus Desulfofervidus auxilii]|uniref:Haloacid dehalogenase type II n=1 Tax=Desulfofervidus auxilii TaxID=1621989 RepID=A0A7V0I9V1_DESA2|nr:haloacid dehalogenase type II [Candidatus Desulfofervidus auxilii]